MNYYDKIDPQGEAQENECLYCGSECDDTFCSDECERADYLENCKD